MTDAARTVRDPLLRDLRRQGLDTKGESFLMLRKGAQLAKLTQQVSIRHLFSLFLCRSPTSCSCFSPPAPSGSPGSCGALHLLAPPLPGSRTVISFAELSSGAASPTSSDPVPPHTSPMIPSSSWVSYKVLEKPQLCSEAPCLLCRCCSYSISYS